MHELEHRVLQQEEYQPASSPLHSAYQRGHLRLHDVTKVYSPAPTVAPSDQKSRAVTDLRTER